jgi:hypothetical protein
VLSAAQEFSLEMPAPGTLRWVLRDGSVPGGPAVRQLDERQVDRGDQLSLSVAPAVPGEAVAVGQPVARLRSPLLAQQSAELQAQQRSLQARQALFEQGSRPAEVAAAQQAVRLAAAELEKSRLLRQRQERLMADNAAPTAGLEQALADEAIREAALSLARSGVAVARAPARPEAIAEIEAELQGLASQLELLAARTEVVIESPIAGLHAAAATPPIVAQVLDLSVMYAHFAVEEASRGRYPPGQSLRFHPVGGGEPVDGELVAIAERARTLDGRQVFWASARFPRQPHLHPGMGGSITQPQGAGGWLQEVLYR